MAVSNRKNGKQAKTPTPFGARLKATAKAAGVSAEALAEAFDMTSAGIYAWWSGRNEPGASETLQYSELVGRSVYYLVKGQEEPAVVVNLISTATKVDDPWQQLTGEERQAVDQVVRLLAKRR